MFGRGEAHRRDRRQPLLGHRPGIPAVLGDPQPAAGRAKGEELAGLVDRERMSPYQIIGMALRQSLTQHLEAATAVAGTRHDHFAVDWDAPLIFDRRDKPGGIGVTRMGGDGKAEFRWTDRRQLIPISSGVLRPEDAIVVLAPDDFRACGAVRQMSWTIGSSRRSGGMYSLYMP